MKKVLAIALLAACSLAQADPTPAKKALIDKVLQLQRPSIEAYSRSVIDQSTAQIAQQLGAVLQQRVPPDKREALGKDIQGDLRKYTDESVPMVREHALKLMPGIIGSALDEKFSEAELKQVIAFLESPVFRKFQQTDAETLRALSVKLLAEMRPELEPKLRALDQTISKRLQPVIGAPPGAAPGAPQAPASASKP